MSSQALIESMSRRVAEQREAIIAEAQQQAEQIKAASREAAAALREKTIAETERDLDLLRIRWEQKAEADAARAGLAMKNEAVEAVLNEVAERVVALVESDDFPEILDQLCAELMTAAEGEVVVLAPAKHVEHVRAWLASHGHESVPVEGSDTLHDGVALQDPDRTYRISNTLSSRYSLTLQEARKVCMTSLFQD